MATSRIMAETVESSRVTSHGDLSHHGGNCPVESHHMATTLIRGTSVESHSRHRANSHIRRRHMSSRVESHHMVTSRITAETVQSSHRESDLLHNGGNCRVESSRVESSRVTSHGDRPIASWRKLSSRVTSHGDYERGIAGHTEWGRGIEMQKPSVSRHQSIITRKTVASTPSVCPSIHS